LRDPGPRRVHYAIALTRPGAGLAARLAQAFPGIRAFAPERFAAEVSGVEGFAEPISDLMARLWPTAAGFFLVMAAGIAVRSVAPLLGDKATDPAVVIFDAAGRFAVPILSGHLGGANDLAREAGRRLGSTPVITTATDVAGAPAVEVWARKQGLRWEGAEGVVRINAAWASADPVGGYVDPVLGARELLEPLASHLALSTESVDEVRAFSGALFAVTFRLRPPFPAALVLRPGCLYLGVGCRKGADPETVRDGIEAFLVEEGLSPLAAAAVVTVDQKAREPALVSLAASLDVPFWTYPATELAVVPVPTPSRRAAQAVGTPSVSEAAALLAAGGGPLLVPKIARKTWTLAVALGRARTGWRQTE
jgi:cobalt-precorrin 5A hydrolase